MTHPRLKVKKGDTVLILAGKDKGQKGKVLQAMPREGRILVEGINMVKRHTKPTRQRMQGGIVNKESPVRASNVMVVCPRCKKPSRMGRSRLPESRGGRVCKKCSEVIDK